MRSASIRTARCSRAIDGASLRTARIGDRILVNKFIYGAKTPDRIPFTGILLPYLQLPALRSPRRGDIVVFHYPEDLKVDFVKRLAGLPGDTLEIRDGPEELLLQPVPIPIRDRGGHRLPASSSSKAQESSVT